VRAERGGLAAELLAPAENLVLGLAVLVVLAVADEVGRVARADRRDGVLLVRVVEDRGVVELFLRRLGRRVAAGVTLRVSYDRAGFVHRSPRVTY
jgi:hypothetical protein